MSAVTAHQKIVSVYKVKKDELPVSCPRSGDDLSSMHPRVFLKFDKDGKAVCPYCGAEYILEA